MDIDFRLDKMTVRCTSGDVVVSGSVDYLRANFKLVSNDWQPPITALFNDVAVLLDDNNSCMVPWEVTQNAGTVTVSAYCGDVDNDNYLHTANCATFTVDPSCYKQGETPKPPTPDVYQSILNKAQNAENVAQSVRNDADAGLFDGADGKDGKDGLNGKDGANGTTYTPHIEPVKGGNALSWTNDGGKPNPETVTIKDGESVYCDNQPKHVATGELIALDDVYKAQPLVLCVEGKTVKDESGLTCVESAEIEVAGKNLVDVQDFRAAPYGVEIWRGREIKAPFTVSLTIENGSFNIDNGAAPVLFLILKDGKKRPINTAQFGMAASGINGRYHATVDFIPSFVAIEHEITTDAYGRWSKDTKVSDFQIEVGNTATPYEAYHLSTLPIDLQSNKLCSLPNGVCDELRITREGNRGHVELVKRTADDVLNDISKMKSYSYYPDINKTFLWYKIDNGDNYTGRIYSSALDYASENAIAQISDSTIQIRFAGKKTKEEMQQWVLGLNIKVVYKRIEQTIDLGYIDLPELPAPNATVWTSSNLPIVTSSVEYVQDINVVLSKLMQAIVAVPAMI